MREMMAKDYLAAFLRLFKTSSAQPCTFSTVKRPVGGRSAGVQGMLCGWGGVCVGGVSQKCMPIWTYFDVLVPNMHLVRHSSLSTTSGISHCLFRPLLPDRQTVDLEKFHGGNERKLARWFCPQKQRRFHGSNMFPYHPHVRSSYPPDASSLLVVLCR